MYYIFIKFAISVKKLSKARAKSGTTEAIFQKQKFTNGPHTLMQYDVFLTRGGGETKKTKIC